jgi:hypothetical protein
MHSVSDNPQIGFIPHYKEQSKKIRITFLALGVLQAEQGKKKAWSGVISNCSYKTNRLLHIATCPESVFIYLYYLLKAKPFIKNTDAMICASI